MGAINKINVNGITYDILGLPVGTIFTSALPQINSGVHLLDGSYIATNGIYSDFCKLVKELANQYPLLCSEDDYLNDLSLTGSCGKFVLDETNNTLRLPTITTFIQGLSDIVTIGKVMEAGLPSIEHTHQQYVTANSGSYMGRQDYSRDASSSHIYEHVHTAPNTDVSEIYGKSETVQPPSVKYPYYIVLATIQQTDVEVNIDNITNDLNNKVGFNNLKRYTTETWRSSDGLSWYTLYNDGWKECGGSITSNSSVTGRTIVFPIEFSSATSYQIIAVPLYNSSPGDYSLWFQNGSRTNSSILMGSKGSIYHYDYYCCGY